MLPAFLIVGAQRCGTTSMYRTLSQHPAALKAVLDKGVHYFDLNYHRGANWYRTHFPLEIAARRLQRRLGAAPQTFASSPYYMVHPLAPARIAADLPGVKLLVLDMESDRLREQGERLAADPDSTSHEHQHNAYLAREQYIDYLEDLAGLFGRDRLHVVDSQALLPAPGKHVRRCPGIPRSAGNGHPHVRAAQCPTTVSASRRLAQAAGAAFPAVR